MAELLATSSTMVKLPTAITNIQPLYLPHPPWHPMYSDARDNVERVQKLYAADVQSKANAANASQLATTVEQEASLQFELTPSSAPLLRTVPTMICSNVGEIEQYVNSASSGVWLVPECRQT